MKGTPRTIFPPFPTASRQVNIKNASSGNWVETDLRKDLQSQCSNIKQHHTQRKAKGKVKANESALNICTLSKANTAQYLIESTNSQQIDKFTNFTKLTCCFSCTSWFRLKGSFLSLDRFKTIPVETEILPLLPYISQPHFIRDRKGHTLKNKTLSYSCSLIFLSTLHNFSVLITSFHMIP